MTEHLASEDLAAYVDGALQGAAKAGLEAHLCRCPECLQALAEIVDIQGSRARIPGDFLSRAAQLAGGGASGRKPGRAWARPPLRLAFGIAAVFLVAIVVGYFFIGREPLATPRIGETAAPRRAVATEVRQPPSKATAPAPRRQETAAGAAVEKMLSRADREAKKEAKLKAGEPEPGRPAPPAADTALAAAVQPAPEEEARWAAEADEQRPEGVAAGGVVGGVEAPAAKDKGSRIMANAAPEPGKGAMKDGLARARSFSQAAAEPADAMQLFLAVSGRAAAPPAMAIAGMAAGPFIRLAGEVSRDDLENAALLDSWLWFPEGLALELEIDAAGTVTAVAPLGAWDEHAAARAIAAARQLRFAAAGKKSRRAVLSRSAPPT